MSEALESASRSGARDLVCSLVETPSVSGEEEAAAQQLVEFFEGRDREVRTDEVGNVHAPADDGLLLTSHLDTVPGEVPVRIGETDGGETALWGRGSVDAKGSLAAMAVAAARTGASFLGVVGEETDSRGARHAVETLDEPGAVVNGEPSGWDAVALGYRGVVTGIYATTTESAHSAGPSTNAIQDAIDWYGSVEAALEPESSDVETFDRVTCKPLSVDGGSTDDGLAVEATMGVEFRIPPSESVASVRETVEGETVTGDVEWSNGIEPVMQSPRTPVARAFRVAIRDAGGEPRLLRKTGTSDMNVFAGDWECPMVTYGPGDAALDHAPNEHLVLSELDRAVGVLTDVTEQLLESGAATEQPHEETEQ